MAGFGYSARQKSLFCVSVLLLSVAGILLPRTAGATGSTRNAGNTGGAVSIYPGINNPGGIAAGPDGALWFTNEGNNTIGRVTTSGTGTGYVAGGNNLYEMTVGPDGNLWFTAGPFGNSIGRITTSGVVTVYTGPDIVSPF